jgi:GT2 family glycosyltransferase
LSHRGADPGPDDPAGARRALDRQVDIGRRQAEEIRRLEAALAESKARQAATRDELNALRRRLPVRILLGLERRLRPAARRGRTLGTQVAGRAGAAVDRAPRSTPGSRSGGGAGATGDEAADEAAERAFLDAIERQLGGPARTGGPLVSIVLLNRDGADLLRRCLPGLAATAYRDVELIAVDNASSDESVGVLEAFRPGFPVRVIRNATNESFSAANNRAVAESHGELVLFLNNDIEPIGPDWLGHLVSDLDDPAVVATGARLIYPRRTAVARGGLRFPDLSLQHGGVGFRLDDGIAVPAPLGAGTDALSEWAAAVRDAPALTAACLLVRRAAFEAVRGFDEGYDYGLEDVDLCLRLREAGGRLVYDGRAALWHHESTSRVREDRDVRVARSRANRERFVGTWGPRLTREVLLDALAGDGSWCADRLRIVAPGSPPAALRAALAHAPWEIVDTGAPADVGIVSDPGPGIRAQMASGIRVGWIDAGTAEAWLGAPALADLDLVVTTDPSTVDSVARAFGRPPTLLPRDAAEAGAALASAIADWVHASRVAIRIGVKSWPVAESWGDLHVARDLARALRRQGRPVRILIRPEWDSGVAARDDVSIHVLGASTATLRPGQVNVLWHLSHPDIANPDLYDRYDLAFVASEPFARRMADLSRVPVAALPQATDPERFHPGLPGPAHELLFVGNSRGVRRHILDELLPTDHELAVYGRAWTADRLDPRYLAGEHVPNEELAGYYGNAAIVLNDHWLDMQREGFLSNRLYDAAAAGAFVISDDVEGLEAAFDGGIAGYVGADELRRLVDTFLADPAARRDCAERARAAVLARHTFDHRARTILDAVEPLLAARDPGIAGPPLGGSDRPLSGSAA